MHRRIETEILDGLPAVDPAALESRRDLHVLNWWMRSANTVAAALQGSFSSGGAKRFVDLGAGDGSLMLKVARRLGESWSGSEVWLVDREDLVTPEIKSAFSRLGWKATPIPSDLMQIQGNPPLDCDATVVNLFLHHLHEQQLRTLLGNAEAHTRFFVAHEPRRGWFGLLISKLVGVIGCNWVTRHDAPASVRAGFTGREISALWPVGPGWTLTERRAGAFGHLFSAVR